MHNNTDRATVNKHNAAAAIVYKETKYVIEILKERVIWPIRCTTTTEQMKVWEEIPNVNDPQLLLHKICRVHERNNFISFRSYTTEWPKQNVSVLLNLPFKHYNESHFSVMIKSVHHQAQSVLPLQTPTMNAIKGNLAHLIWQSIGTKKATCELSAKLLVLNLAVLRQTTDLSIVTFDITELL